MPSASKSNASGIEYVSFVITLLPSFYQSVVVVLVELDVLVLVELDVLVLVLVVDELVDVVLVEVEVVVV